MGKPVGSVQRGVLDNLDAMGVLLDEDLGEEVLDQEGDGLPSEPVGGIAHQTDASVAYLFN